ncbi:hypothetical protein NHX12_026028 [Muraenolepis orangiensis]|uniref:Reverse transcriptase n=1 Tax=Muraenolepis orangiensis TaxID=630683 RepID=A0A9Q0IMX3_9TELE|nr:hypothetical protein NHX12_026028 [Muraenolepis orangiensis]
MLRRTTWSVVEQGLNQDMGILAAYLRKWRLQLSTGKTVSAAYHLCNKAKRELSVSVDNKRLEHQLAPKYLGVRLDRTLSYKQHLEEVRAKVTARVSLIRRLAGTTWGASARTLRISTQALVFSAAEYCAPVWSRSPHVKKVDPIINNALRIITGCLKPTPVSYLPVLATNVRISSPGLAAIIIGVPEEAGTTPMAVSKLLKEAFELEKEPLVDRSHHTQPKPRPGERPHAVVARLHYCLDCVDILKRARERKGIKFGVMTIFVFPDYTAKIARARAAFNDVRRELRDIDGLRFTILHPARLRVTYNGMEREFTLSKEAETFVRNLKWV